MLHLILNYPRAQHPIIFAIILIAKDAPSFVSECIYCYYCFLFIICKIK